MVFGGLKKHDAAQTGVNVFVLPETIAGRLNDAGQKLWRDEIQKLLPDKAVIFGAELPASDGRKYGNAVIMLRGGEMSAVYQRIPVPYSMYRGPFAKTGANLHFFNDGILNIQDGRKAAVIICYEAFLTWPVLIGMRNNPDVIICAANLWWCKDTSLPSAQKTAVSLWALTFGVPAVFAWNI
jgi:apolipoprotein N-acyltransferase